MLKTNTYADGRYDYFPIISLYSFICMVYKENVRAPTELFIQLGKIRILKFQMGS